MKESVAIAKDAAAKKEFSHTMSDNSIQHLRNEPERQLGSLRDVIDNIRSDGGTLSVDRITTELSSMHTAERAPVLMALQRTHGNRYVQRVVAGIQAKLEVGQPGDIYEQEADWVAEAVMQMSEPEVRRQLEEEGKKKEEKTLQTKEVPGQTPEVTPDLVSRINALKGGGQPLPESTRAFFELRFGYDLSRVQVHTNSQAAETARALNARAFTMGHDIVFGAGEYAQGTTVGKQLLAHELTHVVQQGEGISGFEVHHFPRSLIQRLETAEQLIDRYTSWGNLDEEALGAHLLRLTRRSLANCRYVQSVLNELSSTDRDDVSVAFSSNATDGDLVALAGSPDGRALLDRLYDELTSGSIGADEQQQANRILAARGQVRPIEEAAERVTARRRLIFPFRLPGLTVLSDAPISAERIGGGRIRVSMPPRVLGTSMFRAETRTLPTEVFIRGYELDADEWISVKLYDEGGVVISRPALYLLELSNRTTSRIWQTIGTTVAIGLTFGVGGGGAAGGAAAARGVTWGPRVVTFLDRASIGLFLAGTVVREHRGWIIETFGDIGRALVEAMEVAESLAAVYGLGRVAFSVPRVISSLRNAWRNWRTSQAFQQMSGSDLRRGQEISQRTERLLDSADEATAAMRREVRPGSPEAPGPIEVPAPVAPGPRPPAVPTRVRAETIQRLAQMEINGVRLTEAQLQSTARTFEVVEREVAQAVGGQVSLRGYYIPAGQGQTVANPELGIFFGRPFEVPGPAYPDVQRGLVIVGRDAVQGTTIRGNPQTLRTIIRHEVGEVLESGPRARWPQFGHISTSHWRSSARGALLPGTTRAEQITLLQDARALGIPESVGRTLARQLNIEAEVYGTVSIGRPPIIPPRGRESGEEEVSPRLTTY